MKDQKVGSVVARNQDFDEGQGLEPQALQKYQNSVDVASKLVQRNMSQTGDMFELH